MLNSLSKFSSEFLLKLLVMSAVILKEGEVDNDLFINYLLYLSSALLLAFPLLHLEVPILI